MATFSFSVGVPIAAGGATAAILTEPIDLERDDDGDLVLDSDLHWTHGIDAVAQGLQVRLQTWRGEWFLDLDRGIPYLQELLGHKFDEVRVRVAFRQEIAAAPGVEEILRLSAVFNRPTRELTVAWEVRTEWGLSIDELAIGV